MAQTVNMVAGNGYRLSLSGAANVVARAECYVKAVPDPASSAPATPAASPAPLAGASTDYVHMQIDEIQSFEQITYLLVWAVGSGLLVVNSK